MAISWGAWEYSGGNGMRVGIEVTWEAITSGEAAATATIEIWTENQFTYGDSQTLNYGGSIGGSTSFSNNSGGSPVKRATKTYTYDYPASSYGSSPGSRTFTASLSGAYNGVTPSKSVTSSIPARPIAAPTAPTNAAASRVSDATTKVSWTRTATSQRPWETIIVHRSLNGAAYASVASALSGSSTYYNYASAANQKLRFRVYARNDAGTSAYDETGDIYTTPSPPTSAARTDIAGPGQRITWVNKTGYTEYVTEIIGYKNGVSVGVLGNVGSGVTSFDHTTSNAVSAYTAGDRWKYTVRHRTSVGTALYSAETTPTSETAGVTSPPNAPSGLTPNGEYIDPTVATTLAWTHNPTDSTAQQQYQIRHRVQGAGSWTTEAVVTSAVSSASIAANTYTTGQVVEWQVTTKGANATWSPWSSSAFINMLVTKLIPATVNIGTNNVEADVSGYDWKDVGTAGQPGFLNSWANYTASSVFKNVGFCRRAGVVWLKGLAAGGTPSATSVVFVLPVGYRPLENIILTASSNNAYARLEIRPNGEVVAYNGSSVWYSLEGVSFLAEQ